VTVYAGAASDIDLTREIDSLATASSVGVADEALDQAKRKAISYAFQERWTALQPGLVVGEYALFHVVAAEVMGFATDPLMFQDFREVWCDR
jgi:hypothetical protein